MRNYTVLMIEGTFVGGPLCMSDDVRMDAGEPRDKSLFGDADALNDRPQRESSVVFHTPGTLKSPRSGARAPPPSPGRFTCTPFCQSGVEKIYTSSGCDRNE